MFQGKTAGLQITFFSYEGSCSNKLKFGSKKARSNIKKNFEQRVTKIKGSRSVLTNWSFVKHVKLYRKDFLFFGKFFGEVFRVESSQIIIVLKFSLIPQNRHKNESNIFFFKMFNYWIEIIWPKKFYAFSRLKNV